jgi:hypothetical protein
MWYFDHPSYEFSIGGFGANGTGGADYPVRGYEPGGERRSERFR